MEKVIIIGSGPAGLTAAIYTSRANLDPLILAGESSGGQLMITSEVENFPGFPEGVMGPDLMAAMIKQVERFKGRIKYASATAVDFSVRPFRVTSWDETFEARTVIIATGADAIWLGIESEARFRGRGVSTCATCDGAFYRGLPIAVVGGGDSALEEALFLTRFASQVHILHRRDAFRGSKIMQDRVLSHEKIVVHWNTIVDEVQGDNVVRGLRLKDTVTGTLRDLAVDGLFVAVGHRPNTAIFKDQIEMDENGYIVVHGGSSTSVDGVFVAGDVHDHRYQQAITAAGAGCKAAIDAERWLESQGE